MAESVAQNSDHPSEPTCLETVSSSPTASCGAGGSQVSCGNCGKRIEQLTNGPDRSGPLPIAKVLMVFFLPLAAAAAVVIWALRSFSALAEHPGYVALTALAVAVIVLILVRLASREKQHPQKGT